LLDAAHTQLYTATLHIYFEDADLHYLTDGDDGQRVFDEAISQL